MGIRNRNLQRGGAMQRAFGFGCDFLYPPNDCQHIVPSTSISSASVAGALTLSTSFTDMGNQLLWPIRPVVVLRNRVGTNTAGQHIGAPGIPCPDTTFAGNDQFEILVTGALNGRVQSEVLTFNIAAISTQSGQQYSYMRTLKFYDEITSIALQNITSNSDFGLAVPMQLSVGTAVCELGEGSTVRVHLLAPNDLPSAALLRRVSFLDNISYDSGTATGTFQIEPKISLLHVPGRAPVFGDSQGLFTVQVAAETLTKTAHGLTNGMVVQVENAGDGLPTLLAERTNYYVVAAAADTFMLSAAADLYICASDSGADTLTFTAHGLANGTPVRLFPTSVSAGNPTGVLPAPLSASTTYYVVNTAANTFQVSLTSGGAAVNITGTETPVAVRACIDMAAGGTFADGEAVRVIRPSREWRRGRLLYSGDPRLG